MTKELEFYFDFSSPYSFLAYKQIKKIEKEKRTYKEKTEGPYSLKDADTRVAILKNITYLYALKNFQTFL